MSSPMRKKTDRNSAIQSRRRVGIEEVMMRNTQNLGMSEGNGMKTLMIERDRDIQSIGSKKSVESPTGNNHDKREPMINGLREESRKEIGKSKRRT